MKTVLKPFFHTKATIVLTITSALTIPVGIVSAADQERKQEQDTQKIQQKDMTQDQEQDRKMIYGWELMSAKERDEHRQKMLGLKTEEERTAYRLEHHKLMQQRAKERGVTIPDVPAERGSGSGFGGGQGTGGGRGGN